MVHWRRDILSSPKVFIRKVKLVVMDRACIFFHTGLDSSMYAAVYDIGILLDACKSVRTAAQDNTTQCWF